MEYSPDIKISIKVTITICILGIMFGCYSSYHWNRIEIDEYITSLIGWFIVWGVFMGWEFEEEPSEKIKKTISLANEDDFLFNHSTQTNKNEKS